MAILAIPQICPSDGDKGDIDGDRQGDAAAQTKHILEVIKSVIETAGGTMDDVTMNNIMLKSWDDYAAMNKVYAEYFPGDKPARWCIVCGLVRPEALVEIGSIAHIGK